MIPHRRVQMKLDIEADSLDDLASALRSLASDLELREEGDFKQVSGGFNGGHSLDLSFDQSVDHDSYLRALDEWRAARKPA